MQLAGLSKKIVLVAVLAHWAARPIAAALLVSSGVGKPIVEAELMSRGLKDPHNGWATYYNTEGGPGACGWYSNNNQNVVAIGKPLWDSAPGRNGASSLCGKAATIRWHSKSVRVRVVDECPTCGYNDIDLSPSAFRQLGKQDLGKLNGVTWNFE